MLVGSGPCSCAAAHRSARRRSLVRADWKVYASSPLLASRITAKDTVGNRSLLNRSELGQSSPPHRRAETNCLYHSKKCGTALPALSDVLDKSALYQDHFPLFHPGEALTPLKGTSYRYQYTGVGWGSHCPSDDVSLPITSYFLRLHQRFLSLSTDII